MVMGSFADLFIFIVLRQHGSQKEVPKGGRGWGYLIFCLAKSSGSAELRRARLGRNAYCRSFGFTPESSVRREGEINCKRGSCLSAVTAMCCINARIPEALDSE